MPNIAHTVPRNELQWFEMNGMGKYTIQRVKRQYNSRHSESVDPSGRFTPSLLTNKILPLCRKPRMGKIHRDGWYICDANHTIWASTTTFHYNPSPFLHSFCLHASPCPSFHFWQDCLCPPKHGTYLVNGCYKPWTRRNGVSPTRLWFLCKFLLRLTHNHRWRKSRTSTTD